MLQSGHAISFQTVPLLDRLATLVHVASLCDSGSSKTRETRDHSQYGKGLRLRCFPITNVQVFSLELYCELPGISELEANEGAKSISSLGEKLLSLG